MKKKNLIGLTLLFCLCVVSPKTASADNPIAQWHMDEGGGSIISDSSGNNNNGVISGATWLEGVSGGGLYFDGVDDGVILDGGILNNLTSGSMEFWFKLENRQDNTSRPQTLFSSAHRGANLQIWLGFLGRENNGKMNFRKAAAYPSIQTDLTSNTNVWEANSWYQVVITWHETNMSFFVNGELDNFTGSAVQGILNSANLAVIGSSEGRSDFFKGIIDEVSIYNRALTAEEIKQLYLKYKPNSPPIVDAGPNITINSADIPYTKINGTASDPDEDPLTYQWFIDTQGEVPVDPQGNAVLNLANLLREGSHEAILEVSDGRFTVTDSMILTVNNSPPVVVPKISGTYKIGEDIILRADVADFDGDTLDYKWYEGDTIYNISSIDTYLGGQPVALPNVSIDGGLALGDHIITLEVNDGRNPAVIKSTEIKVIDSEAPTLAPVAEPTILWPPNHQMVPVEIYANAKDNSSGPVTLSATVTSSEPPETDKNGNIIPDYTDPQIDQLTGKINLQLRAERQGKGTGRIYTITITALDESNNSSQAKVEVVAPHDRGDKK